MPVLKDPSIGGEDEDVDEEDHLSDGKSFSSIDDNRQNLRAIHAAAMADDQSDPDAQNRAAE